MPKLGIQYCIEIMRQLDAWDIALRGTKEDIDRAICIKAGMDDSTRKKYIEMLQVFGFIKPVEGQDGLFDLDHEKGNAYANKKRKA